jgi:hypothetical protein
MAYPDPLSADFPTKLAQIQKSMELKRLIEKYTKFLETHDAKLRVLSIEQYTCAVYQLLLAEIGIPTPLERSVTPPPPPRPASALPLLWVSGVGGVGVFSPSSSANRGSPLSSPARPKALSVPASPSPSPRAGGAAAAATPFYSQSGSLQNSASESLHTADQGNSRASPTSFTSAVDGDILTSLDDYKAMYAIFVKEFIGYEMSEQDWTILALLKKRDPDLMRAIQSEQQDGVYLTGRDMENHPHIYYFNSRAPGWKRVPKVPAAGSQDLERTASLAPFIMPMPSYQINPEKIEQEFFLKYYKIYGDFLSQNNYLQSPTIQKFLLTQLNQTFLLNALKGGFADQVLMDSGDLQLKERKQANVTATAVYIVPVEYAGKLALRVNLETHIKITPQGPFVGTCTDGSADTTITADDEFTISSEQVHCTGIFVISFLYISVFDNIDVFPEGIRAIDQQEPGFYADLSCSLYFPTFDCCTVPQGVAEEKEQKNITEHRDQFIYCSATGQLEPMSKVTLRTLKNIIAAQAVPAFFHKYVANARLSTQEPEHLRLRR